MSKKNQEKGITLVALVITIIIIIILATITIGGVFGENGLINNTKYTAFSADVRAYEEAANRYVLMQKLEHGEDTNINIMDKEQIKEAIPGITDEDAEKYVIQDNEFKYNPDYVTEQEETWLIQLGIAAMKPATLFTVTFMVNGSVYHTINTDILTFPETDPTSDNGSTFGGWFYDESYSNQANEGDKITENVTLYAKWINHITNKLNNASINMFTVDYPEIEEGDWYYVENEEELADIPNSSEANPNGGPNVPNFYPAWVKYGNYSATEKIYSYEGSANIVSARIISWTMGDRETPFTYFDLSINSNGEVYVNGDHDNYIGYINSGYAKIEVTFEDGSTDTDEFSVKVHYTID